MILGRRGLTEDIYQWEKKNTRLKKDGNRAGGLGGRERRKGGMEKGRKRERE